MIPCRNEADFISDCLDSIIENGYSTHRLEILVIDGMSTDGTREMVRCYSRRYPFLRLIDNPRLLTPCALNLGIESCCGEIVIRMDAHATYNPGYIAQCVDALERYKVASTGGCWNVVSRGTGMIDRGIVGAMRHRFGGASWYRYPSDSEPKFDELVPFFCCRRETLDQVGPFNERLVRHQDFEFTARMRRMGGRLLLVPRAVCNYYARSDLRSFAAHSFRDGMWVVRAAAHTDVMPVAPRHLVPLAFVLTVAGSSIAAVVSPLARCVLIAILAAWMIASLVSALQIALQGRDWKMVAAVPLVLFVRHITFGTGSLAGTAYLLASPECWRRLRRRPVHHQPGLLGPGVQFRP